MLLEALVEAGADLNVQDGERKWSPMMLAAYDGNYEIVNFLKKLGVNLDLVSDAGIGIKKIVKILIGQLLPISLVCILVMSVSRIYSSGLCRGTKPC